MASPTYHAQRFSEVFADELRDIQQRRSKAFSDSPEGSPRNLVGLALSGGGIRSATFALGVLQGLNKLNLLHIFDYLSTVSGGGFAGGWWSAWLSRERGDAAVPPKMFPDKEWIEPQRSDKYSEASRSGKMAEGSINASEDPVHHLRLFANYLTPRRGALSMDTWRAIGTTTRNLILTWLVLLPVLLAAVLLGQVYFAFFSMDFPHETVVTIEQTTSAEQSTPQMVTSRPHLPSTGDELGRRKQILKHRAFVAVVPVAILGGVTAFFAFCWLIGIQGGNKILKLINAAVGALLVAWLASAFLGALGVVIAVLVSFFFFMVVVLIVLRLWTYPIWLFRRLIGFARKYWKTQSGVTPMPQGAAQRIAATPGRDRDSKRKQQWQKEVYLNTMTRWMSRSMTFMVFTAAVMLVAGFGHEAVEYVCCYEAPGGSLLKSGLHYAAKSLSITSVFTALAGLIFTWGKSAPAGGGDKADTKAPSPVSRLIFAITPPLVIAVLAVLMAWLAHALVSVIIANPTERIGALTMATRLGIYFAFILVLLELDLSNISSDVQHLLLIALTFITMLIVGWLFYRGGLQGFFPFPFCHPWFLVSRRPSYLST